MPGEGVVPAAQHTLHNKPDIGEKRGARHVLGIKLVLRWKNDTVIVGLQTVARHLIEDRLFAGEGHRGGACDSRAALKIEDHVLGQLWARTDQAHVPQQDINYLGQLVELPASQKWTDGREGLIVRSGHRMIGCVATYGSEFNDRE